MFKNICTLAASILLLVPTLSGQAEDKSFEDPGDLKIVRINLERDNLSINDIEVDNNNRTLVASDGMLFSITSSNQIQPYLVGKNLDCVIADKKLNIYAAGENSLFLVTTDEQVKLPENNTDIRDIAYQRGKVWLATNRGIFTYVVGSGSWTQYTTANSKLKSDDINTIRVDDQEVMWIGTDSGYIRIKDGDWELEDKKENIISSRGNKEGQWMVAIDNMWLIDPFNRKYPIGLDKDFYSGQLNDFVIDTKGRVYMASDILVRYNPYKETIERYGEDVGLLTKKCLSLACDKNNNIWIGTADAGLFRIVFDDIAKEQLAVTPLLEQEISCADEQNAIIKLNVTGGTKPYNYKWSERSVRGANPNGLKAGSYAVTVTDKLGVETVGEITIAKPEAIVVEVAENRRISGDNKKDGYVALRTSGGTGTLTTKWSNGKTGNIVEKLAAGSYTATVTDENGCKEDVRVNVRKEKYIPELDISKVIVGQKLRINELNFKADSTNLEPENFEILDEVYEFLVINPNVQIEIGGHTNTIPSHEYCDKLSTARAKSVKDYIVERGIPGGRITFKGYGKREPLTESTSLAGRRKNQRVEVTILSL